MHKTLANQAKGKTSVLAVCAMAALLSATPAFCADTLNANQSLRPGQQLASANGVYQAVYQTDGNFVVYGGGRPLWNTHTNGRASDVLIMQNDGNLVIYKG